MREQLVQFGQDDRLSGIMTLATDSTDCKRPVVIFLNAGIVHRVGPNRLHVKLARALAAEGYSCLRFDLSGLGESPPAPPGLGYEAQSIEDTRAAVDCMVQAFGGRPVILAGICSGADNSYRTALEDERISGIMLLDPYAYQNTAAQISDLAKRAQDPERWKRLAGKLVSGGRQEEQVADQEIFEDDNDRIPPEREVFGADLQALTDRGVNIFILYSSSVRHLINAPEQFFKTFREFDFGDAMSVDVLGHVDHTYTELSVQGELIYRMSAWLAKVSA